ncbi:MCE family protein [Psychroserpens burtonensis]|uniref:MCE family protein n=1 Tax=Psychroserpens burtonensis TaxID=49278 RepID=A0A5C7BGA7_9FLAO|nr:MlaD family protein [Psychroserpens burtonensis]TXE20396.1 MCE family protein [Psychroserpens burtonensis]
MKISREIKAAILVLSGILLMVFLINYLNGKNLFENDDTYYTEFDYNALTKASPVTVKGNNVGKIQEIIYDFSTGKTRVSFTIDDQLNFSKQSKIRLYKTGLMGGNALAIVVSNYGEPAKPGDYIASEVEEDLVSSLTTSFSDVSDNLDSTLSSADSLLVSLNGLVRDESDNGIKSAIAELNATMKSFKSVSYSVNSLVKENDEKLSSILSNFDAVTKDLAIITNDLKDVKLSKTVANLDNTLTTVNTLMASIENGEGSIGKLLKDEGLYQNLEGAALQMNQLLEDMKLNPKRYVHFSLFGKKAKRYDADGNEIEDKD